MLELFSQDEMLSPQYNPQAWDVFVKLMWLKPHGMLVHRDGQWVPKFDER
jgi:hypothetical protein